MQPIIELMEHTVDILTWSKKTGEIIFQHQDIQDSNVIELLKDTLRANLHHVGKMEFYRGLDLLNVKLNCIKHPKNKGLLTNIKGHKKVVNRQNSGKVKKIKPVKQTKNVRQTNAWISWV